MKQVTTGMNEFMEGDIINHFGKQGMSHLNCKEVRSSMSACIVITRNRSQRSCVTENQTVKAKRWIFFLIIEHEGQF